MKRIHWYSIFTCLVMSYSLAIRSQKENLFLKKTDNENLKSPDLLLNFEGLGMGFKGPNGEFKVEGVPPDTTAAIGPSHYVQLVNSSIAVFNKSGQVLYGPMKINAIWKGFGGTCENSEDGQGNVIYDHLADRWLISQVVVTKEPYLHCMAISSSKDPWGPYHRYSYGTDYVPDTPRVGLWMDAYYYTFNMYNKDGSFDHSSVCAYERNAMLEGLAAREKCIYLSAEASLRFANLSGSRLPPPGSPQFLLNLGNDSLNLWKFRVDWNDGSTQLTGPIRIPVAPFSIPCGYLGCIPQLGSQQKLDSVADRIVRGIVYRNFGDHESLLVSHTIATQESAGIRWYEIRSLGSEPKVFQHGTYAPDSNFRWLANIAFDKNGGIAMAYSVSSSTMHPGIRFTGRLATDPLGFMGEGEGTIIEGKGSQQAPFESWGATSAMDLDPIDGCTFYFTSEYLANNGTFNWHTRIASFRLPGCVSSSIDE